MFRTEVKSSNIKSIGYDVETKTLEIEFKSSKGVRVYQHHNVNENEYTNLMLSESKGKYYAANIKNKFDWKSLMETEPKNFDNCENSIDVKWTLLFL